MFSISRPIRQPDRRRTRREIIRIGGLSLLGLSDWRLAELRADGAPRTPAQPPRANACVFVFLFGGPSHIDLWDMKPDAPLEIRGEFKPIETNCAGIHLCEHLPKLAQSMDKFCLLRSMTHRMPVHGPACSEIYSGRPYFQAPTTDQASPDDWPSIASLVMRYGTRDAGVPPSVVVPWYTQFAGQGKRIAGQTGGRMGERFNPFLIKGDPSRPDFRIESLDLPRDMPLDRLVERGGLLERVERRIKGQASRWDERFDAGYGAALAMLEGGKASQALNLSAEPAVVRESYGPDKFAQSLLLARRLVENGVSLVTVNWDDETGNETVSPFWDTHDHNFAKLKERLCPRFDHSFSAFLDDLESRGLLDTTLVVATGEFGRSPKIGQIVQNGMTEKTGRDHWPHAFSVLLAGAGVPGGHVLGATNSTGGYVEDRPVTPADLAATILSRLGIDSNRDYRNTLTGVSHELSTGVPIAF